MEKNGSSHWDHMGKPSLHKVPVGRERVEVGLEAEVFTESVDDLDNTHRALEQARA